MGFLFENTTPDRFQQLCQSLLLSEYPDLQCFPVGQPDGGRDALSVSTKTVVQVKFKRADEEENSDWLITALEKEAPKIEKLVTQGAENYIMVTNARGTAHLQSGRIDLVQNWLDKNVSIPAVCYWRDEIDRRLDLAPPSLKLKYSEIVTLEDGLDIIFSGLFTHQNDRRDRAIRLFIVKQYNDDTNIKFRQLDLSNELLGLFVDVPIGFPRTRGQAATELVLRSFGDTHSFYEEAETNIRYLFNSRSRNKLGAGDMLLSQRGQDAVKLTVLEGAPGQGKSTLAQFVCQVHRAKYLGKIDLLERLSDRYKTTAFRLPIKVDLRDFAKFLDNGNPFESGRKSSKRTRSLEGFLGDLIEYGSGGIKLDEYEIQDILTKAPVLLFLDGLDEVADIRQRRRLVSLIGETLERLEDLKCNLQVVVTSRPSVFGKVASFKKYGFHTATLGNIGGETVVEYARKWIAARKLDSAREEEILKILEEKTKLHHFRELTRNPMQLTILLTLIHQFGYSLPDQRTDLYQKYLDLSFIREAEKSTQVQDNKDALVGFIEYLAWHLQSQAEAAQSAGSVTRDQIVLLAREYLAREGIDSLDLAENLFGGGLERVYVLVERIEGLYEFEIQPLREYFCAHYLYTTAPTTHRDSVINGDRAQRFEAIASNPFWLNVTRFYAGFHVRGELGSLVSSIREMIASEDPGKSIHARRVGLALLQDRIFTKKKFYQADLIRAIFDRVGIVGLINGSGPRLSEVYLHPDCGQDLLRSLLFEFTQIISEQSRIIHLITPTIRINSGELLEVNFRDVLRGLSGAQRSYQLAVMFESGAASKVQASEIEELLVEDRPSDDELMDRVSSLMLNEPEKASASESLSEFFINGVTEGRPAVIRSGYFGGGNPVLDIFLSTLGQSSPYGLRWQTQPHVIAAHSLNEHISGSYPAAPNAIVNYVSDIGSGPANAMYAERSDRGTFNFELWDYVIEKARVHFGECWSTRANAIQVASAIPKQKFDAPDNLGDEAASLCKIARWARMNRGDRAWWLAQLEHAVTEVDRMFWAGLAIHWSTVNTLQGLTEPLNSVIEDLDNHRYSALRRTIFGAAKISSRRRRKQGMIDLSEHPGDLAALIAISFDHPLDRIRYGSKQVGSPNFALFKEWREEFDLARKYIADKDYAAAAQLNSFEADRTNWPTADTDYPYVRRYRNVGSLSDIDEALSHPDKYSVQRITRFIYHLDETYQPDALDDIVQRDNWVFE